MQSPCPDARRLRLLRETPRRGSSKDASGIAGAVVRESLEVRRKLVRRSYRFHERVWPETVRLEVVDVEAHPFAHATCRQRTPNGHNIAPDRRADLSFAVRRVAASEIASDRSDGHLLKQRLLEVGAAVLHSRDGRSDVRLVHSRVGYRSPFLNIKPNSVKPPVVALLKVSPGALAVGGQVTHANRERKGPERTRLTYRDNALRHAVARSQLLNPTGSTHFPGRRPACRSSEDTESLASRRRETQLPAGPWGRSDGADQPWVSRL